MKRERNMFQTKEPDKTLKEKKINEMEISDVLEKELKLMLVKMLTKLIKRMEEHYENLNNELGEKSPIRVEEYNNWNEKYTRGNQ